jgi:hypothetical protein
MTLLGEIGKNVEKNRRGLIEVLYGILFNGLRKTTKTQSECTVRAEIRTRHFRTHKSEILQLEPACLMETINDTPLTFVKYIPD